MHTRGVALGALLLTALSNCGDTPRPSTLPADPAADAAADGEVSRSGDAPLDAPLPGQGGADAASGAGGIGGTGGNDVSRQRAYVHRSGACPREGELVSDEGRHDICVGGCAPGCRWAICRCQGGRWACYCPVCPQLELGEARIPCRCPPGEEPMCQLAGDAGISPG